MRLLFVSTTAVGGSGRSQRELASRLTQLGHEVAFLIDADEPAEVSRWVYGHLSDLSARWGNRPGSAAIQCLEGLPGRHPTEKMINGRLHRTSPIPENAAQEVFESFRPDIAIGNSIARLSWRKIKAICDQRGIATVLYIREVETLNHCDTGVAPANAIVANAESLARQVEQRGFSCAVFPSVIETDITEVKSSREVALVINPIESRGVEMVWKIAKQSPQRRFVVQESWPLSGPELAMVEDHVATLPNVGFRRSAPPGPQLYSDTRVLLVPYRVDNRPRVITEAQSNGIPVLAADVPALKEAIGDGGTVVPIDDIDGWVSELRSLWNDRERYERLAAEALAHSQRPEIDPAAVAGDFEKLLENLLRERQAAPVKPDA